MTMRNNLLLLISTAIFMAACGNNTGETKPSVTKDSTSSTAAPAANAASDKGLELIGSNDCTACHSVRVGQGPNTGPAYEDVAVKYAHAGDTIVNHLIKKIVTGGTGAGARKTWPPTPASRKTTSVQWSITSSL